MQQYSMLDNVLIVGGIRLTSFAEGDDSIAGARNEDAFDHEVGSTGQMLVLQNANKSGTMTFNLQQGAEDNTAMGVLFDAQENSTFFAIDVAMVNTVSAESIGGTKGYIKRPADVTRGTGANSQQWEVVVEDYTAIFGPLPTV